jgi:hypothetical protein
MNDQLTRQAGVPAEVSAATLGREELILGKPPRIQPLGVDEIADAALESIRNIRRATGNPDPSVSAADVPEVIRTLLRHPVSTSVSLPYPCSCSAVEYWLLVTGSC